VPNLRIPKEMLELAEHILDAKAGDFDPNKFRDEYELALRKLSKRKATGKKVEAPEPADDGGKVIDLMEALRRSVRGERGHKAPAHGNGKQKANRRHRKAA
jgi:DNA end-binding protein Ku